MPGTENMGEIINSYILIFKLILNFLSHIVGYSINGIFLSPLGSLMMEIGSITIPPPLTKICGSLFFNKRPSNPVVSQSP